MVAVPTIVTTLAGLFSSAIPQVFVESHGCDPSKAASPLSPAQQTALGPPTHPLSAVGVAFGVQNYTCSTDNVFKSVGAVAELFDITHLASTNSSLISTVHKDLFNFWNSSQAGDVTVQQLIETLPYFVAPSTILGQHYFIKNDTGALSPVWDSRATPKFKGQKYAVIVAKVLASAPDADPTENVAWLHLGKVSGDIADEVYRTSTVGGVPPSSCVSGKTKDISLKYASQYWFYGGTSGLGPK